MSRKKTLDEWQIDSDTRHNNEFILLDKPKDAHDIIHIKHLKCGNIIKNTPRNHLKNYCKYCSGKHKRNLKEWQIESDKVHNNEYRIIKLGKNGKSMSKIIHLNCGKIFEQSMNNHINHNQTCSFCSNRKYSLIDLQERSDFIHNSEYKILELPKNFKEAVDIKHLICGNINKQSISNHILGKRGCSICCSSIGEKNISMILDELKVEYHREHKFNDCKNIRILRFDFFLPEFNICIEYDGKQHFEPIEFFGGTKYFNVLKASDKIKNNYLKNNNIKLMRFDYTQNVEQIKETLEMLVFDSD